MDGRTAMLLLPPDPSFGVQNDVCASSSKRRLGWGWASPKGGPLKYR